MCYTELTEGVYMPRAEEIARGGTIRYRTKKLPNGKYIRFAIVRKKGPKGGHTVAGPVRSKGM